METTVGSRLGIVARLWTYPIKSLRAVAHETVDIVEDGLLGDRRAALYVASPEHARAGKTYRGKEDNRLHLVDDPAHASRAAGQRGVDVEVRAGERYFDAAPVSVILRRWIAEVEAHVGRALDPLRWRPNVLVDGEADVSESDLVGKRIAVGTVLLRCRTPIGRCVTTTYDQVTGESDEEILRFVARNRDNRMGVYCDVEQPGVVRIGDVLELS